MASMLSSSSSISDSSSDFSSSIDWVSFRFECTCFFSGGLPCVVFGCFSSICTSNARLLLDLYPQESQDLKPLISDIGLFGVCISSMCFLIPFLVVHLYSHISHSMLGRGACTFAVCILHPARFLNLLSHITHWTSPVVLSSSVKLLSRSFSLMSSSLAWIFVCVFSLYLDVNLLSQNSHSNGRSSFIMSSLIFTSSVVFVTLDSSSVSFSRATTNPGEGNRRTLWDAVRSMPGWKWFVLMCSTRSSFFSYWTLQGLQSILDYLSPSETRVISVNCRPGNTPLV